MFIPTYKLLGWIPVLGQEGGFSAAKAVHDVIMQDGQKIGESSDSVRLGILSVFFVTVVGLFVWGVLKVVIAQYKKIEDQDKRIINDLAERLSRTEKDLETERDARRNDQSARNATMQWTIDEFVRITRGELKNDLKSIFGEACSGTDLMRRYLNLSPLPVRELQEPQRAISSEPPAPRKEPPPNQSPSNKAAYLPAGPRRVPRIPHRPDNNEGT